jgi:hypothetical protein
MEQLWTILFKDIRAVRINDTFERPEMATDFMESDLKKLNMLYWCGGEAFANHEAALKNCSAIRLILGRTRVQLPNRAPHTPPLSAR